MILWVDDIRPMPEGFDIWAKNYNDAIMALKSGQITHVSFDHDLSDIKKGIEKTGYDIAIWVEEAAYNKKIPKLTYAVHSANPVGAAKIELAMRNAERYWNATI